MAALDHDGSEPKYWAFKKITYSKDNEGVRNNYLLTTYHIQFPQTTLREIRVLKTLDHKNVIKLHDIITSKRI